MSISHYTFLNDKRECGLIRRKLTFILNLILNQTLLSINKEGDVMLRVKY